MNRLPKCNKNALITTGIGMYERYTQVIDRHGLHGILQTNT